MGNPKRMRLLSLLAELLGIGILVVFIYLFKGDSILLLGIPAGLILIGLGLLCGSAYDVNKPHHQGEYPPGMFEMFGFIIVGSLTFIYGVLGLFTQVIPR